MSFTGGHENWVPEFLRQPDATVDTIDHTSAGQPHGAGLREWHRLGQRGRHPRWSRQPANRRLVQRRDRQLRRALCASRFSRCLPQSLPQSAMRETPAAAVPQALEAAGEYRGRRLFVSAGPPGPVIPAVAASDHTR